MYKDFTKEARAECNEKAKAGLLNTMEPEFLCAGSENLFFMLSIS